MYSLTTQFISLDTLDHRPHGHKTFEYEFGIRTPKSSIQKSVFMEYGVLIGCFLSTNTCIPKFYDCNVWWLNF
jgi:hypothetical protein